MTKKLTLHQNCPVCSYWIGQIREYRARALKGAERAFRSERIARRELTDHLARTANLVKVGGDNAKRD
jgi:hypothetical protein